MLQGDVTHPKTAASVSDIWLFREYLPEHCMAQLCNTHPSKGLCVALVKAVFHRLRLQNLCFEHRHVLMVAPGRPLGK